MDQDTNILEGQIDIQTTKQNDPPSDKVIISHLHATKIFFKLTENSTFGQKTEFNKQTNQPTNQPNNQPYFQWLSMQETKWVICNF